MTRPLRDPKMNKVLEASGGSNGNDPQGHYRASGGRLRDPDSSKRLVLWIGSVEEQKQEVKQMKIPGVTTVGALSAFQFHMHFP